MKRVPEAENDFMEGFSKWLESEDGQHSMEAVDYVFEALKGAEKHNPQPPSSAARLRIQAI